MKHKDADNTIVCITIVRSNTYGPAAGRRGLTRYILAVLLTVVFTSIALLHVYWALAGGGAAAAAGVPSVDGEPLFRPSPGATLVVAAALFTAAFVIAGAVGWLGSTIPASVFRTLTLGIAIVFLARAIGDLKYVGFFKSVTGSGFAYWDTRLYSPLCLFIAAAAFYIFWKHPE